MPARHAPVNVTPGAAVAVSDGSVTAIRVNNLAAGEVFLQATATSAPPANRNGAQRLGPYGTLAADLSLANLFPGVGAGPFWVWAFADTPATLSVSHA
jgi:hypothetical protein